MIPGKEGGEGLAAGRGDSLPRSADPSCCGVDCSALGAWAAFDGCVSGKRGAEGAAGRGKLPRGADPQRLQALRQALRLPLCHALSKLAARLWKRVFGKRALD